MKKLTQCERILNYIKETGSITQLEALQQFGCMRLASRITDLKKQGYDIISTMQFTKNKYNETVRFAKYSLQS